MEVCVRGIRKRGKGSWERIDGAGDRVRQQLCDPSAIAVRSEGNSFAGMPWRSEGVVSCCNGSLREHVRYSGTRGGVEGKGVERETKAELRPFQVAAEPRSSHGDSAQSKSDGIQSITVGPATMDGHRHQLFFVESSCPIQTRMECLNFVLSHSSIRISPLHPHRRIHLPPMTIGISLRARRRSSPATEQPLGEVLRENDRIALLFIHRILVADGLKDAYFCWIDEGRVRESEDGDEFVTEDPEFEEGSVRRVHCRR